MKNKVIAVFILLLSVVFLQAQNKSVNDFFEKYKADSSFTIVNISPSMFSIISGMDIESMDADVKELLNSITGLKILSKNDGNKYYKEALQMLNNNPMEELMSIKEEDSEVLIYGKNDGNQHLSEVIMLTLEKNNFVLMQIMGKISLSQLSKLSSTFNR
ncbi:DUF4252 domain-containing protein [Membranihabitans marinus]|uniref:DUF4252 domain-containing protein n=1 Tax=Membranihabitans marinus TaxID=1227546 RepID=UPI001F2F6239|nr:DUF4252 domain-containing protein [Membranihabitans marinus]